MLLQAFKHGSVLRVISDTDLAVSAMQHTMCCEQSVAFTGRCMYKGSDILRNTHSRTHRAGSRDVCIFS